MSCWKLPRHEAKMAKDLFIFDELYFILYETIRDFFIQKLGHFLLRSKLIIFYKSNATIPYL